MEQVKSYILEDLEKFNNAGLTRVYKFIRSIISDPSIISSTFDIWKHIKSNEFYSRYEDMSPDGRLDVLVQEDGDVIVQIVPESKSQKPPVSVEFCIYSGGG